MKRIYMKETGVMIHTPENVKLYISAIKDGTNGMECLCYSSQPNVTRTALPLAAFLQEMDDMDEHTKKFAALEAIKEISEAAGLDTKSRKETARDESNRVEMQPGSNIRKVIMEKTGATLYIPEDVEFIFAAQKIGKRNEIECSKKGVGNEMSFPAILFLEGLKKLNPFVRTMAMLKMVNDMQKIVDDGLEGMKK